tara:strand:+ start:1358 stop:2275 length:918 start_codon:yes stop_codon:yes gene_type:complete
MESLDLNIDNYDYEDILNLFKLNINFGENELKNAKKQLLSIHPDKSGLDKKYFLFFSSAYKMLYKIFQFRMKAKISENKDLDYENTDYMLIDEDNNKEVVQQLRENKTLDPANFNKWFNNLFEKVKISTDYDEGGYGDWLKSSEDLNDNSNDNGKTKINNLNAMNEAIERKKEILRNNAIISHKSIIEYNDNNFCDLTNSSVQCYSSGMFSNLQYEDLKKAHTESVVPVTNCDFKSSYNNYDEARELRKRQNLTPLSEEEAREYLNNNKNNENIVNSRRAYKLIKQEEDIDKANKLWWSSLKQLK